MAVSKQTYSASPTWTAQQAADLFRSAFIDAGLMTEWHSSFNNGSFEHRVLEVVYDATKTYGKCYYWFLFSGTFIGVSIASSWTASATAPSGTALLDFHSNLTNNTQRHFGLGGTLSSSTELQLVRYTSGLDGDFSYFVIRAGASTRPFMISPKTVELVPWLDLDKVMFHEIVLPQLFVSGINSAAPSRFIFQTLCRIRRSFLEGGSTRGLSEANFTLYSSRVTPLHAYESYSQVTGNVNVNTHANTTTIVIPQGLGDTNPAYSGRYSPVLFGCSYSPYTKTSLPQDMAIHFPFVNVSLGFGDKIVVDAGIEEWEILAANNNINADAPSTVLLARVI
jgi:hypothetical protein